MTTNYSIYRSVQYAAIQPIFDEEGSVEYWVPLRLDEKDGKSSPVTTVASTVTSSESSSLLPSDEKTINDRFFKALGFATNPFRSGSDIRNNKASDMRLAMLSNFSTAYNIVSISLALDIMEEVYPATPQDKSLCSSALIAGMIVGQLVGGAIGDVLGRHLAMAVVMGLQVVGALVSAFSFDGYLSIYMFLAGRLLFARAFLLVMFRMTMSWLLIYLLILGSVVPTSLEVHFGFGMRRSLPFSCDAHCRVQHKQRGRQQSGCADIFVARSWVLGCASYSLVAGHSLSRKL
jgi:hypothetical protein